MNNPRLRVAMYVNEPEQGSAVGAIFNPMRIDSRVTAEQLFARLSVMRPKAEQ